ncbi:MAG: beta-lactamase family protein, partial [Anaerolineales bacterium]|nr:beta-lactamase family protein [Anaerolineales bacterium]
VADAQASQQITIRHLLQHTSGLSERDYPANFPPDTPLEDAVRGLSRVRLSAPVGARMQYFNPGYSVLGLVIETLSGQSYGDFIREHIFVPLKMARSFTDPAEAEAAGLAQGYGQVFGFAAPLRQRFYSSDLPAGFIVSTANDMARYLIALGNGGELDGARVLEAENVELLFTPNTAIGSTYGFGWMIGDYYGEPQITHGGDTERFHTAVLLLPESGRSLVLLINENHLLKDLNEYNTMLWGLASIMTDQPMPQERLSSTIYGWGLLAIWIYTLVSLVRKAIKLPQWRAKIAEWNTRRRWTEIIKHLAWIAITVLIVTVVAPALIGRAFVWKWFAASLPEAAIIAATLMLDDAIQLVYKLSVMIQAGRRHAA